MFDVGILKFICFASRGPPEAALEVELGSALELDAEAVPLDGKGTLGLGSVALTGVSPVIPNHLGRKIPVAELYKNVCDLCNDVSVILPVFSDSSSDMHLSIVSAAGAGGFGSNVAQYALIAASAGSKTMTCNVTLISWDPTMSLLEDVAVLRTESVLETMC